MQTIACPHCARPLSCGLPPGHAVACPYCQGLLTVPAPILPVAEPPAFVDLGGGREPARRGRRQGGGEFGTAMQTTMGGCFGGVLGVLVVAGVVVAGCGGLVYWGMHRVRDAAKLSTPEAATAGAEKDVGQVGLVRARVSAALVGKVPLEVFGEMGESEKEHLTLRVTFDNVSTTRKVDFNKPQGWFSHHCTMYDDLGNRYKSIHFGLGDRVYGAAKRNGSIYPGQAAEDLLVFELPVQAAKAVMLEIDGEVVGERGGKFRLTVPAGEWKR